MRIPRIFVDEPLVKMTGVRLSGAPANHVIKVLRLKEGAELVLFDDSGMEFSGTIDGITKDVAYIALRAGRDPGRESPLDTTLVQGLARGERMDYSIQKTTELGIWRIAPIAAEHSVVKIDDGRLERRMERWRNTTIAACEQSGRTRLPTIETPRTLAEWLESNAEDRNLYLLDPDGARLASLPPPRGPLAILVGPEGGWSQEERQLATDAGAYPWQIGARTLRTETAGAVALALAQSKWGDL